MQITHCPAREADTDPNLVVERVYKSLIGLGVIATPVWMGFLVYTPGHLIGWW